MLSWIMAKICGVPVESPTPEIVTPKREEPVADPNLIGKYRIVTTKQAPFKFYIQEYRLDHSFKKDRIFYCKWDSDYSNNPVKSFDFYPIFNQSEVVQYQGFDCMRNYFCILHSTEKEAEEQINVILEAKAAAKRKARELEEFIANHPPRIYP